ncbi:Aste57867_20213 [Aphanomyces stellatus]|uniref:Aste57867_20213 protein n=1 Tax=Aphanomyces stellatus TaxID=120398 RepID=A0A485LF60_9STRA|nr:hypothetical protein As57867_020147 [Aphanomyces stellatus]VFT96906.1 Aste57867_20213 [Aphanomyces stellatus]
MEVDVDYFGFDLTSTAQSIAALCVADCRATDGCKLFVWTRFNGGTCWLKHTAGAKSHLPGSIAMIVKKVSTCGVQELDVDYQGNDIDSTERAYPDLCCDDCKNADGCTTYVWTDFNGGTCWLKSAKGAPAQYDGSVSGSI